MSRRHKASFGDWEKILEKVQTQKQPLLVWLVRKAKADAVSTLVLSQILEVSRSHLYGILSGYYDVTTLRPKVIDSISKYLCLAPIFMQSALGIRIDDFFTETQLSEAVSITNNRLPELGELLRGESSNILIFAATLAGMNLVSRQQLRNCMTDGPFR